DGINNNVYLSDVNQPLFALKNNNITQTVDLDFSFDIVLMPKSQTKSNGNGSIGIVFDIDY
ncbi:MAG: hypothetical protein PHG99_07640, partial [Erysipelotrichaceae bacterium]|nr:hypothetical protein [Erysipelotrichaceae bacterium]